MQTPNPPKIPAKNDPSKPAAKPEQAAKNQPAHAKDGKQHKPNPKGDANTKKDLPTPSHIAAKENAETPPSDEAMSAQPGPRMQPVEGSVGQKIDNNTMSDQPDSFRGKK